MHGLLSGCYFSTSHEFLHSMGGYDKSTYDISIMGVLFEQNKDNSIQGQYQSPSSNKTWYLGTFEWFTVVKFKKNAQSKM